MEAPAPKSTSLPGRDILQMCSIEPNPHLFDLTAVTNHLG
jgi:hypothetical protein